MKAVHGNSAEYPYFPSDYQPCTADWATAYLSRKDVQDAIHASTYFAGNWSACSDVVSAAYSQEDVAAPMMPVYEKLLKASPPLKMLIYSGDDDAVCATLGTQQFIWDLGLSVVEPWAPWKMDSGPDCPEGPACRHAHPRIEVPAVRAHVEFAKLAPSPPLMPPHACPSRTYLFGIVIMT